MNALYDELMRRCESVIFVEKHEDVNPTIQELKIIKQKIELIDYDFFKKIKKKFITHSFGFGDKYFAPINKDFCICIPKKSNPNDIYKILKGQELYCEKIIKDFNSSILRDCIFDITTKDNEDKLHLRLVTNKNK
jgi:hypothetical protein